MTTTDKAEGLIKLAEKEFGKEDLTDADLKLFTAVANGKQAIYFTGDLEDVDPAKADDCGPERTLDANRIIWLCTNAQAGAYVTHKGVTIGGACVVNDLDLTYAEIPFPLLLIACRIKSRVELLEAKTRTLSFSRSYVEGISADGVHVDGGLFLNNEFTSNGEVRLFGATIGSDFTCSGGLFTNVNGNALSADRVQVKGSMFLDNGFTANGTVRLLSAKIGSDLDCSNGSFTSENGPALGADRVQVAGNMFLSDGFTANGEVRLLGATIGGGLDCRGGLFRNEGGKSLSADGVQVSGTLSLSHGFAANGEVRLPGATIGSNLDCSRSSFKNKNGDALIADHMKVSGSVFLDSGITVNGEVRLLGATIGGNLSCRGGSFTKNNGCALDADGLDVNGSVFLDFMFSAKGEVRMLGAKIGGNLECRGGSFANEDACALNADRVQVTGSLFLNHPFAARGEVRMLGATVGGNLDCSGGSFTREDGYALNADGLEVGGDVFLNAGFTTTGEVRMSGATIGGDLDCRNGSFENENGHALLVQNLRVSGNAFLDDGFSARGRVDFIGATIDGTMVMRDIIESERCSLDLTNATVSTLWDEEMSWPASITLDGFVYERISPLPPDVRLKWLQRQPTGEFRPQPYEKLASVLQAMGHDDHATKIRIEKERAIAADSKRNHASVFSTDYWWYQVWRPFVGYGYKTWPAWGVACMFFLVLGLFAFGAGQRHGVMTPMGGSAYAKEPDSDAKVSALYPKFNFIMYSIDAFVPIIDFGQAKHWSPNPNRGKWGVWLRCYLWVHTAAGWVLSTIFVVTFTGILKR